MLNRLSLSFLCIVLALPITLYAQSDSTQLDTIYSLSRRYSVDVPNGWYASNRPEFQQIQGLFIGESITLASNETLLDTLPQDASFDTLENVQVEGVVMLATTFPAGIVEILGLDPEAITLDMANTLGIDVNPIEPITIQNNSGFLVKGIVGDYQTQLLTLLNDNNHLLISMFFHHSDFNNDVTAIQNSICLQSFEDETLTNVDKVPVIIDMIPNALQVSIPNGWWILQAGQETPILMPTFDIELLQAISGEADLGNAQSIFMMGMLLEDDLDNNMMELLYTEDGNINEEFLELLAPLLTLIEDDGMSVSEADSWQNPQGLEGLSLTFMMDSLNTVSMEMIMIISPDGVYMVAAIIPNRVADQFADTLAVSFESLTLITDDN